MASLSNYKPLLTVLVVAVVCTTGLRAQTWKPAMAGFHPKQTFFHYEVNFKNNLLGKNWIYGVWFDQDSVRRCVGYRENGQWQALPIRFSTGTSSYANDIAAHGDTLLIVGGFGQPTNELDTTQSTPVSWYLKWWNDSLWFDNRPFDVHDVSVSGDSILLWGDYFDLTDTIRGHVLSTDGGQTWHYPYSIVHPTESIPGFGANAGLEIYNGQIYTLNNDSAPNDSAGWKGIVRWDGQHWHGYPYGMWGGFARSTALAFYQGDLYMGGSFFQNTHPNNPGNGIAKWNGTSWTPMGGGVGNFVRNLFVKDSLLFCNLAGTGFADSPISYFAGWDGHQWCGTPANFARPPYTFGYVNDTLYVSFKENTTVDGDSVTYMNYFEGDYLYGPNAVCSTYDLGVVTPNDDLPKKFEVYPNPTAGLLNIAVDRTSVIKTLTVYDVRGQLLQVVHQVINQHEWVLNLSHLPNGLYVVVLNNTHHAKVSKL